MLKETTCLRLGRRHAFPYKSMGNDVFARIGIVSGVDRRAGFRGVAQGFRRTFEGLFKHLIDPLDGDDFDLVLDEANWRRMTFFSN